MILERAPKGDKKEENIDEGEDRGKMKQESSVLERALKNMTVEDLTPSEDVFGFKTGKWYKVNNSEHMPKIKQTF